MTETYIPAAMRRQVRERANGCCEYCLLAEEDAYFPHEADHIISVKHRGLSVLENLAWSCFDCNRGGQAFRFARATEQFDVA